jgi:hypothetical protein
VEKTAALVVVASSTRRVRSVRFLADGKQVAVDHTGTSDLFTGTWNARSARRGTHALTALATDTAGRSVSAAQTLRVCR